ncbi:hypothetical protein [Deinococcus aquatilis]|jgi:hypothetical protein|uniref:hypothetical protein n=1 Tax=Deinococcus aquatilis TaxID=519440 RepID=UPI00035E93B6|nr:hypothetical protein [Deinococcus aquatilis]
MKKLLLGLVGLSAALASCGTGVAPDGSGDGRVTQVRTEYRLGASGPFISCDNLNNAVATTQVSVYFSVNGNVQSVGVGLRGNTTSQYDNNYNATVSGNGFTNLGSGSYRLTFNANPVNGLLPQAIVVNPVRGKVKIVNATENPGSFHADLTVNTGTSSYDLSSRLISQGNVLTYVNCTLVSTTNEDV